jgi:toxin YoeB
MKYKLIFSPEAKEDLLEHAKAGNKSNLKKISLLFHELEEHPKTGSGKPKLLKYGQAGIWSRRIDQKHRLLYQINEDIVTVIVIAAKEHYYDK